MINKNENTSNDSIKQQRLWDAFIDGGGATILVCIIIWLKVKKIWKTY